ncbi:MAG: hypothetical protein J6Y82_10880 [Bacteroidales bacterium]|nr:hypothetical protein [Bacteroidales bacterium]
MYVQTLIKEKKIELASSFVLDYENSCNPYFDRKNAVTNFLNNNVSIYLGGEHSEEVIEKAEAVMAKRVKMKDSCHIVCAEMLKCDYLLTTDKRMLKYKDSKVKLINPIDFVELIESEL